MRIDLIPFDRKEMRGYGIVRWYTDTHKKVAPQYIVFYVILYATMCAFSVKKWQQPPIAAVAGSVCY